MLSDLDGSESLLVTIGNVPPGAVLSAGTDNGDGTWTFTFQGGAPGASAYTVESVVTVSTSGEVTVDYNGDIRE